jgi:hypothetical protein
MAEVLSNDTASDGDASPDVTLSEIARPLIHRLFQRTLNRDPHDDEEQLAEEFLQQHAAQHQRSSDSPSQLALTDLCRAVLNLNEFLYID